MNKKITLLLAFILFTLFTSAQTFFSEDFSAGIPVTWSNVDNGTFNVKWRTTTTGALNQSAPVNSQLNPVGTTAANGYLILDSDSAGSGTSEDAILTTPPINCTGHSNVHLLFNEYFAQYLTSTGTVKVSNDNITWVDVHHADSGLLQDMGTPNAHALDIDISATAANQPTVFIRFQYTGAWDYWWFVDDVRLMEPFPIDLSAAVQDLDVHYEQIPLTQATALNKVAEITNAGQSATTGGNVTFDIVNITTGTTVFTETIPLSNISPGASVQVSPVGSFVPVLAGDHKAVVTVSLGGDPNPLNDVAESERIFLSDSVYARDNDAFYTTVGIGAGPGEDGIFGQNFLVNAAGDISSVTFFFDDTLGFNPTGTAVYLSLRNQPNETTHPDLNALVYTDTMVFMPNSVPFGGSFYTLNVSGGPLHVLPGLYFVGMHEVDSLLPIGITQDIFTPNAVWAHWNSAPGVDGWVKPEDFGMQFAYMIRPNFLSPFAGVNEVTRNSSLVAYPNPVNSLLYLNDINAQGAAIKVVNALGKLVYDNILDANSVLNFESYPPGIYIVQVVTEKNTATVKVVKN